MSGEESRRTLFEGTQVDAETFLSNSALLQGATSEELAPFISISKILTAKKGSAIFKEGQPAKDLYIVGTGRVALDMKLDRPDGSITPVTTVASIGPGEAVGLSAVIQPRAFTMSAQAVEDSQLVLMDGEKLKIVLDQNRRVGYIFMFNVAKLLAQRLSETREAFVFERAWLWREKHAG